MSLSTAKKAILKAKIENQVQELLVKTSAELVYIDDATTLAAKLTEITNSLGGAVTSAGVQNAIKTAVGEAPSGATATTVYGYIAEAIAALGIGDYAKKTELPTKVSDLTNDSKYQTEDEVASAINAKLASTYKAGGSVAFASLPELKEANLGLVVNVTDGFTTTASFIEGAGKKHAVGTNVAVVKDGQTYKYDVLAGFVDLSGYVGKETGKGLSTNDYDATEKQKVADAYAAKHEHANKTVLDGITAGKVTSWDGKSRVYYSATEPSALADGDLWFQLI